MNVRKKGKKRLQRHINNVAGHSFYKDRNLVNELLWTGITDGSYSELRRRVKDYYF